MTSQLNVDTIVDKAGSGGPSLPNTTTIKVSNTSTYVSEGGAVTQNTAQGMAKNWTNHDNASTVNDSFNQASTTDVGTGIQRSTFTNAMGNASYMTTPSTNGQTTPSGSTGAYIEGTVQQTTALYDTAHGYSGAGSGTTWTLHDYAPSGSTVFGDLA